MAIARIAIDAGHKIASNPAPIFIKRDTSGLAETILINIPSASKTFKIRTIARSILII
jgi:hypothetical protein